MDLYRAYTIGIRQEDLLEAMKIILEYERNFDKITRSTHRASNGDVVVVYCFRPYVYDDFETIRREFIQAGIQIL